MSKLKKVVFPLIDEGLSIDDLSEEKGFVDMYFEDINRPYLDNHLFLLYNWNDKRSSEVFYKYKSLPTFYGYRVMYINNVPYIVYTFISNSLINRLKNGAAILRDINKQRILQFWQFSDAWITLNVMRGTVTCDPPEDFVPEEDFIPSTETINGEGIL